MKRLLGFGMVAAALWTAENWWLNTQQADLSARLALNQLNGGNNAARDLRSFQSLKDGVHLATAMVTVLAAFLTLGPVAVKFARRLSATPWPRGSAKFSVARRP